MQFYTIQHKSVKCYPISIVSIFTTFKNRYCFWGSGCCCCRRLSKTTTKNSGVFCGVCFLSDILLIFRVDRWKQAAWVCRCDPDLVAWLENDFKATLQNQATLEQWAQWLESVVDRVMKPYEGGSTQEFARVARQFLLKWSFYR